MIASPRVWPRPADILTLMFDVTGPIGVRHVWRDVFGRGCD